MSASPAPFPAAPGRATPSRVRWSWLLDRRSDLVWYAGSSLAGWLYVAIVVALGRGLADPMHDRLATLHAGGLSLPLTLEVLVVMSWAFAVDAPHVGATLFRTFLDPDERASRRGQLRRSWLWFAAGPLAVLAPYLAGLAVHLSAQTMALGAAVFFVFFRLWAYYHVVRQHWGFLALYRRKNGEGEDAREALADRVFFELAMWIPVVFFMSAPWYASTGFPPTGFFVPIAGRVTLASILHPATIAAYPLVIAGYALWQWKRSREGTPRNGPKLLLLAGVVPLHLVVFTSPLLAVFVVPIVTVGHNLQYLRIVWAFGRNKYPKDPARYRAARAVFASPLAFLAAGLVFTFLLYRGPLVVAASHVAARAVDTWLFAPLALAAGVRDPAAAGVGATIVSLFVTGWALQHYWLDARIWRLRKDAAVAKNLGV